MTYGRGYVILAASVLSNGLAVHCRKAALATASPSIVVTGICLFAAAAFLLTGGLWRRLHLTAGSMQRVTPTTVWRTTRAVGRWALIGTFCGAAAGWVASIAFQHYDAALVSFLMNLNMVGLVLAGVAFGERLSWRELAAIVLVVAGALVFSYREGRFAWAALGLVSLNALLTVTKNMSVKLNTTPRNLPAFMAGTCVLMAGWLLLGGALLGELHWPDGRALVFMAANGFLGSFLGMALLYAAFHAVGVSRGAPVDALRPVAVLLTGLALGITLLPTALQLVGGAMLLIGSVLLAVFSTRPRVSSTMPPTPR